MRVRLAPSPTGFLHIGTARTALFNYLYARKQGGSFIVRIEDTDSIRSTSEFEQTIIQGLAWLGIEPDEGVTSEGERGAYGPYRQSQRTNIYRQYIEELLDSGYAYWCPTSTEELTQLREQAETQNQSFVFRPDHRDGRYSESEEAVIRFRVPDESITFKDKIKGEITFDLSQVGDFVIAKSFDQPLYNLAVVVDDELMQISHVIRGEDHIANTPKQILINKALGFSRRSFAHLPLILAPDKSKMSKRFGAVSIESYQEQGYLPEALLNFLALLGWNEGTDQEIYTQEELIQKFNLNRVQKSGAVFDIDKLKAINGFYIRNLEPQRKYQLGEEFLNKNGYDVSQCSQKQLQGLIDIECTRIRTFADIGGDIDFFFQEPDPQAEMLVWKHLTPAQTKERLEWVAEVVYNIDSDDAQEIETYLKNAITEAEQSMGEILWPLRVALSGREKSPSPFEILAILSQEESLKRINRAIAVFA